MADIWNLNALCRCCHKDGYFRSMQYPYVGKDGDVEEYSGWLKEVFGIVMVTPSASVQASVMICDECITSLRDGRRFKQQVIDCELRFQQYCQNEANVKVEPGEKYETESKLLQGFDLIDLPKKEEDDKVKIEIETDNEEHGNTDNMDNFDSDSDLEPLVVVKKEKDRKVKEKITSYRKAGARKASKTATKATKAGKTSQTGKMAKVATKTSQTGKMAKVAIKTQKKIKKTPASESDKNWRCRICGSFHRNHTEVKEHMAKEHKGARSYETTEYSCQFCKANIKGISKYRTHINKTHPGNGTMCRFCTGMFPTPYTLKDHIETVHKPKEKYICDYCKNEYLDRGVIRQHILRVHLKRKDATCPICLRQFNDKGPLNYHIQQVHENKRQFQCETCPQNFKTKKRLVLHTRKKHTFERPYACRCGAAFVEQAELTKHTIRTHSENKLTHRTIVRKDGSIQEIEVPPGERIYRCFMCHGAYRGRGTYTKHLKKEHDGMMPFQCHICARSFASKYVLQRHILSHDESLKITCDICLKEFKHEMLLITHKKRTHGPKNRDGTPRVPKEINRHVKCDICQRFVKQQDLDKHKNRHCKRRFKCHICSKDYSMKTGLQRHLNTHLNLAYFHCDICNKKFLKEISVARHKMTKHPALQKDMKYNQNEIKPEVDARSVEDNYMDNMDIHSVPKIRVSHINPNISRNTYDILMKQKLLN